MTDRTTDTAVLDALDRADGPLSVSSEPGSLDVSIEGRVQRLRLEGGLDDGSCNPPWSSWDS